MLVLCTQDPWYCPEQLLDFVSEHSCSLAVYDADASHSQHDGVVNISVHLVQCIAQACTADVNFCLEVELPLCDCRVYPDGGHRS